MLAEGYTARPARLDDAAAVAAVIARNQLVDFGAVEVDESEVRDDWAGVDLEADTLLIERDGEVVALSDLLVRPGQVNAYGYVHPTHVGNGVGSYLAAWAEQRAAAHAKELALPTLVRHHVASTNRAAAALLEGRGYQVQRAVLWMERDLSDTAEPTRAAAQGALERRLPPGLVLRNYRGDVDEPAVYLAFEAASRDMNGRAPSSLDQWLATTSTKDRELFFIVETGTEAGAAPASGQVAGILIATLHAPRGERETRLSSEPDDLPTGARGHVDSLRVVSQWRRRGIGTVLLGAAFAALAERGASRVGLSVDAASPTGAPNLYREAGMRETRRYLVMERTYDGDTT